MESHDQSYRSTNDAASSGVSATLIPTYATSGWLSTYSA
jgi:hypothetical protein